MAEHKPDIVVSWLQNDYGQLARHAECIAHALVDYGLARRVAYVEPVIPQNTQGTVEGQNIRGLWRFQARGTIGNPADYARAVITHAGLESPILLNCGVAEANWWFHSAFSPFCSKEVLLTHDILHLWPGIAPEVSASLLGIRSALIRSCDMVLGCSHGSIADIPLARYVGHGHDPIWSVNDIDAFEEPKELQKLPRPRVVYLGTLSMRIDVKAIRALAESGLQVVIIGFGPSQELTNIITEFSNITFLGARSPLDTPRYLLHCDVGIVPHTDEPFTWSMEPHKLYNYASAGLRSVVLNCAVPASLSDLAISTTTNEAFVEHVFEASRLGRLTREQIEKARSLDWRTVSTSILDILGFKTATVQQEELTEIREPTSIRGASEANMAT